MCAYKNPSPSVDDDEIIETIQETDIADDYLCKEPVYFAFIDVLGFKKTFDDNRQENNNKFAEKYRDVFNYYFELMNAANFMINKKSTGCYAGQTSDSLYFYTLRPDMLIEFIKIFSHFNLYAMSKDVFFRGGIAKGKLFCKEGYQFYGDSVIYAYLLESIISKNPIVVIDEKTYSEIADFPETKELITSRNERHYIKPFAQLKNNMHLDINETSLIDIRDIDEEKLRDNIKKNKDLFEYDSKNFEKYVFLLKELDT